MGCFGQWAPRCVIRRSIHLSITCANEDISSIRIKCSRPGNTKEKNEENRSMESATRSTSPSHEFTRRCHRGIKSHNIQQVHKYIPMVLIGLNSNRYSLYVDAPVI